MKHKTVILTTILLVAVLLLPLNAATTYDIDDIRNHRTTIYIGEIKQDQHIISEIDGRNIEEAPTGGYLDNGEYLLPYDLGLGHHTLHILILNEWGETIKTLTYNFCIIKHSENPNVYDKYSPYYYSDEVTDEDIEQDYQDINKPLTDIDEENPTILEETLQQLPNIEDYRVNINIKKSLKEYDEGLTSVEI